MVVVLDVPTIISIYVHCILNFCPITECIRVSAILICGGP